MLEKVGKIHQVRDEQRISPDGIPYRSTEWRHSAGHKIEVNQDAYGNHVRIDGTHTAVNLDEQGVIAFMLRFLGRR
jgi:hypothetical protein